MKLLGGISSLSSASSAQKGTGQSAEKNTYGKATAPTSDADRHNVMADVITRHEQIVYRSRTKK